MAPDEALAACTLVLAEAEALQHDGVASRARVRRVQHWLRTGSVAPAERAALDSLGASLATVQPADLYPPEAWWALHRAYLALGDEAAADAALADGYGWAVRRALPQVPQAFHDSFLHRNATNRDLIAAAGRRLGLHVGTALR
jgi:hypothetical protein